MHTIKEYKARASVSFTFGVLLLGAGWLFFAPTADWPELAFDGALLAWGVILLFFAAHNVFRASSSDAPAETLGLYSEILPTTEQLQAKGQSFASILPSELRGPFEPAYATPDQRVQIRREEDRFYRVSHYRGMLSDNRSQDPQRLEPTRFEPRHNPPDPLWERYKSSSNFANPTKGNE